MSFAGPSAHRCLCFGEEDGPNGSYYPCPPELCEADAILERAEAAEAEVQRLREGLRRQQRLTALYAHRLGEHDPGCEWCVMAAEQEAAEARALLAASPDGTWNNPGPEGLIEERGPLDGGGARRLVSVNHDAATDIVGKSAICPDCGNALFVDGGGA